MAADLNDQSTVGVAEPSSPGKYIRNVSMYVVQSDGTIKLTQMQVVGLSDKDGRMLDIDMIDDMKMWLKEIRVELRVISQLLQNGLNVHDELPALRKDELNAMSEIVSGLGD